MEPFRSRVREILGDHTEALETLPVEMYARGLSTRDIEALLADETGKSPSSRTAVSEITERLWAEYEAFASRDLSEFHALWQWRNGPGPAPASDVPERWPHGANGKGRRVVARGIGRIDGDPGLDRCVWKGCRRLPPGMSRCRRCRS